MLNFSNCNCLLQNEQTCHCIKILWILLSYISFAFCLDAFSNFETCCNLKCFALLQYAIWQREGKSSCVWVCVCCTHIFLHHNCQKPTKPMAHTITKHKQASCNHSCTTNSTNQKNFPSSSLPLQCALLRSWNNDGYCCDVVIVVVWWWWWCWKLPEPSKTNDDVQPQALTKGEAAGRQTDRWNRELTAGSRRWRRRTASFFTVCFYAFYFMLSGPTAVVDVDDDIVSSSSSSSSGWV